MKDTDPRNDAATYLEIDVESDFPCSLKDVRQAAEEVMRQHEEMHRYVVLLRGANGNRAEIAHAEYARDRLHLAGRLVLIVAEAMAERDLDCD